MEQPNPSAPHHIFTSRIKKITKTSAYYHRQNIARIKGLDQEKLIHAFISSRVDYYSNGLLTAPPKTTIKQLQLIQNTAARLVSRTKRAEPITPILKS